MSEQTWSETDYKGAHKRLSRKRGKAKEQTCLKCGEPARQWALLEKKDSPWTREGWIQMARKPRPYWLHWSLSPDDYAPLCVACHTHMDRLNHPDARKGARPSTRRRTHCRNGHELTGRNVEEWTHEGKRYRRCAECYRAYKRDAYAKKREQSA